MSRSLVLMNLSCTLFMVGLIWFVQIVHYPLFDRVPDGFRRYEQDHMRLTTWVVAGPMILEAATAVLLLWNRPEPVPAWRLWCGLLLVATIWASTYALQVPRHETLAAGFDSAAHRALVQTNWIRTVAWTLRGILMLGVVHSLMRGSIPK